MMSIEQDISISKFQNIFPIMVIFVTVDRFLLFFHYSIVLVQFPDEQSTITKIIMGHAVESITVGTEAITSQTEHRLSQLFRLNDPHKNLSEEEMARRKTELKQWLEQHHIPVTISGDKGELLNIAEALYIEPPYGLDNCISANEIILGRVQALMKNKPERLDTKEVTLNEEET